ncbi:hypothetical protein Tco_1101230, partial [Tanacetum coccineum]
WLKWRVATRVICDRNVPLKLKEKFYRAAIRPAMLYGSECWPITKALDNRMEVAELRMLRWTCGKTMLDMIPNGVYRAELEVETIINKMGDGRLRWFGHVRRRPQSTPVRRVEALVVDGMRRRGRPKLRWEDRVKLDMKELLLSEDMTSDRNEWRARTSFACEWFACLVSFLLFLFGFCLLDSDRLERWASIRLGGSMEGFEGLVGFGLPLFASSSLAMWCSLLPFSFACFGACVLPCFACPFAVALCCIGLTLSHGVYSRYKIISVQKVVVDRRFEYGFLTSIVVKRADGKEHEFRKSDYPSLSLNDIKDIRVVIKKMVEDAQLGVKSYQKKLNLMKPTFFMDDIQYKLPYTTMGTSKGVVYLNKYGQKMLMRYDEVHKFSDGTLNKVSEKLKVMIKENVLGYGNVSLQVRVWTERDNERSKMIKHKIEKLLKAQRRLESFVGGRAKACDIRLLVRPE